MEKYSEWKWKALHRRRPFYFSWLQLILTLCWFTLDVYEHPIFAPAIAIHGLLFALFTFSEKGAHVLQEPQGKRICVFSCLSMEIFLLMSVKMRSSDSALFLFPIVACLSVFTAQTLGLSQMVSWATIACSFILACAFALLVVCTSFLSFFQLWIFMMGGEPITVI